MQVGSIELSEPHLIKVRIIPSLPDSSIVEDDQNYSTTKLSI